MSQIVQVAGALTILVPFVLSQFRVLGTQSLLYILLNFIGSALLAVLALRQGQWGFLLLEGAWALVSLWSLVMLARHRGNRSMATRSSAERAPEQGV